MAKHREFFLIGAVYINSRTGKRCSVLEIDEEKVRFRSAGPADHSFTLHYAQCQNYELIKCKANTNGELSKMINGDAK